MKKSKSVIQVEKEEVDDKGNIVNKKLKPYWSILLCDFWNDLDFQNTQNEGIVSFPNGKKPEALIYRLINLSNNPQIVMDYFAGSGTTPAVAHKLNKKYIAICSLYISFDIFWSRRSSYSIFRRDSCRFISCDISCLFLSILSIESFSMFLIYS